MPKNRVEQKAETLARIAETARRLFTDHPYEEVSVRRIAATAGLTTGAIYPYFPTKADLWRGVMGTPPPKDSALTRQAAEIERTLRRLLDLDARGERDTEAWRLAVTQARTALDTLDSTPGPKPRARRSPRTPAVTDAGT